jgi:hypothetical protein
MKMAYNTLKLLNHTALTLLLATSLFSSVQAQESTHTPQPSKTPAAAKEEAHSGFCANIVIRTTKGKERVLDQKTKLEKNRLENHDVVEQKRAHNDTALSEAQTTFTQKESSKLESLSTLAKTDAQKQAVDGFKTAVQTATTAHQQAIISANATFRSQVDAITKKYQLLIDQEITTRDSVFQTARKTEMDAAIAAHKTVISSANTSFKTAMEAARTTLKAALAQ